MNGLTSNSENPLQFKIKPIMPDKKAPQMFITLHPSHVYISKALVSSLGLNSWRKVRFGKNINDDDKESFFICFGKKGAPIKGVGEFAITIGIYRQLRESFPQPRVALCDPITTDDGEGVLSRCFKLTAYDYRKKNRKLCHF